MPPLISRSAAQPGAGGRGAGKSTEEEGDDAPIIRLVSKTINEALQQRASDIHVEPFQQRVRIRYRVDGVLKEVGRLAEDLVELLL